ncbi:MAG: hypothetical protein HN348_23945, partial [Proteobacteria bacterium]|nr:hypothetical protein [Pseudomonadota bacterium]
WLMAINIDPDIKAKAILEPVWTMLERASVGLEQTPLLTVCVGDVDGFSRLVGHTLVLSEHLAGPGVYHPDESPLLPPLDRWRRSTACVLEAVATLLMAEASQKEPGDNWLWHGGAAFMVAGVAPELRHSLPDLALAISEGDLVTHSRAGVAAMYAWQAQGHDPWQRLWYAIGGGVISDDEWLALGEWVFDSASGAPALLPVAIPRKSARDVPFELGPWSWQPVVVPAHHRGGKIRVDGQGAVAEPWGRADKPLATLAASTGGCSFQPDIGGPTGSWEVSSAQGFGQVMGARGIGFVFKASGAVEITMADAFVGPLAALPMAEQVGTSGVATLTWHVSGAHQLRFANINTRGLTMHGRQEDQFMMPAKGFGIGEWLTALQDGLWWWEQKRGRLVLRGTMMDGQVEVRLRKAQ